MAVAASLSPDLATPQDVAAWLAIRQRGTDVVTAALVDRFRATLGRAIVPGAAGDTAPLGLHWCLAPEVTAADDLGPDGLPARDGIMPTIPRLPSRMWAGSDIEVTRPLRIGDQVERRSQLVGLAEKAGRSGRLVFARFRSDYRVDNATCIAETQTIVYREPAVAAGAPGTQDHRAEPPDCRRTIALTPPMLFRFSALTFNPHRIHYDQPYATATELYPGLVVQGTLTASLLLDLGAEAAGGAAIRSVRVRAERPVFCGDRLTLASWANATGLDLTASNQVGDVVMQGSATLDR